jgi:hypothetical protein
MPRKARSSSVSRAAVSPKGWSAVILSSTRHRIGRSPQIRIVAAAASAARAATKAASSRFSERRSIGLTP